jgi:polar amino acid transport system substrate-binding protein
MSGRLLTMVQPADSLPMQLTIRRPTLVGSGFVAEHPLISRSLNRRAFLRGGVASGALLGGAALLGTGCTRANLTGNTLQRIKDEGKVRIGFAQELPYGYRDIEGDLVGEGPDVARAVLERMGVTEMEGNITGFSGLIPALQAGYVDIVAAGMFITADRCAAVAFSEPDYCVEQALLVPAENPEGLEDFGSIADTGVQLGLLAGAFELEYATQAGVDTGNITFFPDAASGFDAVSSGTVDAFALTSLSLRFLLQNRDEDAEEVGTGLQGSDIWVTDSFVPLFDGKPDKGCGGFAFRVADTDLREEFNTGLLALHEGGAESEWIDIVEPYGFGEAEMPDDRTTADLCPDAAWL